MTDVVRRTAAEVRHAFDAALPACAIGAIVVAVLVLL